MFQLEGVIALAVSAFLAATLLPASSEAMLAWFVIAEAAPTAFFLTVASVFNTQVPALTGCWDVPLSASGTVIGFL